MATIDLVKCYYESLSPGRRLNLMEILDPDVVFEIQEGFPGSRGRYAGIKQYLEDLLEVIYGAIDLEFLPEEFMDCGAGVVALGRMKGRATRTGVPFDIPFVHLWTSDGRCLTHGRLFTDTAILRDAIEGRATPAR